MRVIDGVENLLPPLRRWHRFAYQHHFNRVSKWERMFHGVYPDAKTARLAIPKNREVGYDNAASATFLGDETKILPSDYPVLFWLGRLFSDNTNVFDFGGYLGIAYHAYKKFGIFPPRLTWTVYDVPAVVRAGRQRLEERPNDSLRFTTSVADAASAEIFLAAGSLQFADESIADILSGLRCRPSHLLISKLPATDAAPFVTLQNMGPAVATYKIFQRRAFVASLEHLGYELVDAWENAEFSCFVPFDPEHSVETFSGFYFRKKTT